MLTPKEDGKRLTCFALDFQSDSNSSVDAIGHKLKVLLYKTSGGHGRRSYTTVDVNFSLILSVSLPRYCTEPNASGVQGTAITGNRVLVQGNIRLLQHLFHLGAEDVLNQPSKVNC